MKKYLTSLVATAALVASGGASAAVSLIYTGAIGDATGGGNYGGLGASALIETFSASGGLANDAGTITGNFGIYNASLNNQYSMPANTTTGFLSVPKGGDPVPASATYAMSGAPATIFGIYVGSPDPTNMISFYSGASLVGSYTLSSLGGSPGADSQNSSSRYLVFDAGGSFDRVTFTTSQIAIEVDNFAVSAIPEPGEWAMMIAGLGVVSLIARRRKTQA